MKNIESAFGDQDILFKVQQEDEVIDYDEEEVRKRKNWNQCVGDACGYTNYVLLTPRSDHAYYKLQIPEPKGVAFQRESTLKLLQQMGIIIFPCSHLLKIMTVRTAHLLPLRHQSSSQCLPQKVEDDDFTVDTVFKVIAVFILLFQSWLNLSHTSITVLLAFLPVMLKQTGNLAGNELKNLVGNFPSTVSALNKVLKTTATYSKKAACPQCERLYDIENVFKSKHQRNSD